MSKYRIKKIILVAIGLTYFILLITSFFVELFGNGILFRTPYLGDFPKSNFIPFSTILTYSINFNDYNLSTWLYKILGNILIFLPLGIIIPKISKIINRLKHIIYVTILLRVLIEVVQFSSRIGVFDVDDIILSLIGSMIGFYLFSCFNKREITS